MYPASRGSDYHRPQHLVVGAPRTQEGASCMAIAPEQTGIGIRRHFTGPDTDPHDEVLWERRDARISNFRDGTVAFEQRDVEFPVSWSQNATNIVAQKYFRGPLGAPGREQSLRQVIDRVVDTVTIWGLKDAYFIDSDEAVAFAD